MGKTYKDHRRRFDDRSKKSRWNESDDFYYSENYENVRKRNRKIRKKELYMEDNS